MARVALKPFDDNAMFLDALDVSTEVAAWNSGDTRNSDSVDLGAADIDRVDGGDVQIKVPGGFTSAGAATVLIGIEDSADDSSFADLLGY